MNNTFLHYSLFIIYFSLFMKMKRLSGRKNNDLVRRKGFAWKGNTMVIRTLAGAPKTKPNHTGVFVGTQASIKLDKSAVKRNRMRRRCREALRKELLHYDTLPTVQLLVSPRSSSLTCAHADIERDVQTFLSSL